MNEYIAALTSNNFKCGALCAMHEALDKNIIKGELFQFLIL